MIKIIGALLLAVFLLLSGAAGSMLWGLQQGYQQALSSFVTELQRNTPSLRVQCQSQLEWQALLQQEQCTLKQQERTFLILEQRLQLRPWGINADFTLTPIYRGQHLTAAHGQWRYPLGASRVHFSLQTDQPLHSRRLTLAPWRALGWWVLASKQGHLQLQLEQGSLQLGGERLVLNSLNLTLDGVQQPQSFFIQRAQLQLQQAELEWQQNQLTLRAMALDNANLYEKSLSALVDVSLQSARFRNYSQELRLDPSQLRLYADELPWRPAKLWQALTPELSLSQNVAQLIRAAVLELAQGSKLTLETLNSDFIYQDRQPDMLGMVGDFSVEGSFMQMRKKLPELKLNISLSQSLLLGPLAEPLMDSLDAGWLYQHNKRLISRVLYRHGTWMANGRPLSSKPLWPAPYVEDH